MLGAVEIDGRKYPTYLSVIEIYSFHEPSSFLILGCSYCCTVAASFSSLLVSVLLVCAALPGKGLLGSRAMFHYSLCGMKASTVALDFQLSMPSCQKGP